MPDPVNRSDNPAIREFYDDDPTGPGAGDVKREQGPKGQATEVIVDTGKELALHELVEHSFKGAAHVAEHFGARVAAHSFEVAGTAGIYLLATVKGTATAFEYSVDRPMKQGEAIGRGYVSDQVRLAGAMITEVAAPGLLPAGYVTSQNAGLVGTGSSFNNRAFTLATRIQTDIDKANPDALAFRDALVSSVRLGIDAVHLHHVDSGDALEGLLKNDSDFRRRFETDPGFQIGVRAAVWQARVSPEDFANADRERGLATATIQLARGA